MNAIDALLACEHEEANNLITVMSQLKPGTGASAPGHSSLVSLVRGLCTHNQRLVSLLTTCKNETEQAYSSEAECFKLFVNDFLNWFESVVVILHKYLDAMPQDHTNVYEKPITYTGCYVAFVDAAVAQVRNPFVVERLQHCKCQISQLLASYLDKVEHRRLSNFSFENIRAITGSSNVSSHFSLAQIVDRSKHEPFYLGSDKIELLLLNLAGLASRPYDALALVKIPDDDAPRSVLFPPFRVNELTITRTCTGLDLQEVAPENSPRAPSISVTGPDQIVAQWLEKLSAIFPATADQLHASDNIKLAGLGIEILDRGSDSSLPIDNGSTNSSGRPSWDSRRRDSLQLIEKTLSESGIGTDKINKDLSIEIPEPPPSVSAEFDYAELVCSEVDSVSCFDIVEPQRQLKPELLHTEKGVAVDNVNHPVYEKSSAAKSKAAQSKESLFSTNGSVIDIPNFGRDYNPSFTNLSDSKNNSKKSRHSIFGLFRRSKGKDVQEQTPAKPDTNAHSHADAGSDQTVKEQQASKAPLADRPELSIRIPKIGERVQAAPLSAGSTSSLPLPFNLPSSTSQYFFKPPTASQVSLVSTGSAARVGEEDLQISDDLKATINSDRTLDFYMTETAPKSLKVSKWKAAYGKWELLSVSESLFIKIVVNYELNKCWMLVFKEEFDDEENEVIDKPLLILDLDLTTKARKSNALDLEIRSRNSVTGERMLIIVRCYEADVLSSVHVNIDNAVGALSSSVSPLNSAAGSNYTLASSLMGSKPSASSTLSSIYTQLTDARKQASPLNNGHSKNDDRIVETAEKLLLDRITVRLHKQMESYEKVNQVSSWKTLGMRTLSVYHSEESNGVYHFETVAGNGPEALAKQEWAIPVEKIEDQIEKLGKAALLLKVAHDEIYMFECRGKKEFDRLIQVFASDQ